MEAVIIFALLAVAVILLFMVWDSREARRRLEDQISTQRGEAQQAIANTQQVVQQRIDALDQRLNQRLDSVQGTLAQSLTGTTETIGKIGEQLGSLGQAAQRILDVGKDIAGLQDILQAPKLRGGFGELLLERLLVDVVPHNHALQHRFRNGVQVDAVIQLGGGLVPVDSKFPVEAFRRLLAAESEDTQAKARREFIHNVQSHIDAVAKYIIPDEGTFDFALMYIPAEGVYYETFFRDERLEEQDSLWSYTLSRRVIPVSPNCFFAYLQAIVLGLRGLQVEEKAREIVEHLGRLGGDFGQLRRDFEVLGGHISHAKSRYDALDRDMGRFGDRLAQSLEGSLPELPAGSDVGAQ